MKLRLFFALVAISLYAAPVTATEPSKQLPNPFPGLRTQVIQENTGQATQQISYDPALAQLLTGSCDFKYNTQGIGGIDISRLLSVRLDRTSQTRYIVCFDPGASNDPTFVIVDNTTSKPLGVVDADHLLLPGNGFIYAMGRTNKLHIERRKFAIRDAKVVEVKQPFLYVGLESKANASIVLTSSKGGSDVVASVPKGERLTVVISDEDWLLIKTNFGLAGWFKTAGNRESPEIEGIYFDGD